MDPRDRAFADIAMRLQFLSREQVDSCTNQLSKMPGKRLAELTLELGFLSSAEVDLIKAQEARQVERQRSVARSTPGALVEERARRSDPRSASSPKQPAVEPSTKASKRSGARAWDVPSQPALAKVIIPRAAEAPPATSRRTKPPSQEMYFAKTEPTPFDEPARPHGTILTASGAAAHAVKGVRAHTLIGPQSAAQVEASILSAGQGYLEKALLLALEKGASDLHVHSGCPLLMRIDGSLMPLTDSAPTSAETAEKIIVEVMTDSQWAALSEQGEVDFVHALPGVLRCRGSAYRQERGIDAVFRIIPDQRKTLQELHLPQRLASLVEFESGLVLCSGPIGSGTSNTLSALIELFLQSQEGHVLTIEDPIEHVFSRERGLCNQRQVGDHTGSASRALYAAQREDPDLVAITDLRDRETIALALSLCEAGHLVLATLHAHNAAQAISRIVGAFAAEQGAQVRARLADCLRAVVSQRLLPLATGSGRVPALELLMANAAISNLIREDKVYQIASAIQTGKTAGMIAFDDSLVELVAARVITADCARLHAHKKERFR